jgi:hypothetical protein
MKEGTRMVFVNSLLYHIDNSSLKERTNKLIFYGKSLPKYYNKHGSYAMYQLLPISSIYFRNIGRIRNPLHLLGFIFLKILEYLALLVGVILQSMEKQDYYAK